MLASRRGEPVDKHGPGGLYSSEFEHDSCGVGFIARLDAQPDHGVIRDAKFKSGVLGDGRTATLKNRGV